MIQCYGLYHFCNRNTSKIATKFISRMKPLTQQRLFVHQMLGMVHLSVCDVSWTCPTMDTLYIGYVIFKNFWACCNVLQ